MNDQVRIGDWMQTFTGKQFWPLDPRPSEIDITDIAHSLSMQCRYGGHCLRFYSVAEHSVLLSRVVSPENALWALLHDAAEAYLVDVPRPVKRHLGGYEAIEATVLIAVAHRFNLRGADIEHLIPAEVKDADNRILVDEKAQNMAPGLMWGIDGLAPLGVQLECWSPPVAEQNFLDAFYGIVWAHGLG